MKLLVSVKKSFTFVNSQNNLTFNKHFLKIFNTSFYHFHFIRISELSWYILLLVY